MGWRLHRKIKNPEFWGIALNRKERKKYFEGHFEAHTETTRWL